MNIYFDKKIVSSNKDVMDLIRDSRPKPNNKLIGSNFNKNNAKQFDWATYIGECGLKIDFK